MTYCCNRARLAALLLLALCLFAAPVLAEYELGQKLRVVNCEEYVTLRETPSQNAAPHALIPAGETVVFLDEAADGFLWVVYEGERGYVQEAYLELTAEDAAMPTQGLILTQQQRYGVNAYLTNFSAPMFAFASAYDESQAQDGQMIDFAVGYLRVFRPEAIEKGWFAGHDDARINVYDVVETVRTLFGRAPRQLSDSVYGYLGGAYYFEDMGTANHGFACLDKIRRLEENRYAVDFTIYAGDAAWTDGMLAFTPEQAKAAYPDSRTRQGFAIFHSPRGYFLGQSDGWVLERWAVK